MIELRLYPLFGGYWGYRNTPLPKVQRILLALRASDAATKEQEEEIARKYGLV